MKISREELKEAFRQAQSIVTEELEAGMPETDVKVEGQDWQMLYKKGLEQKKENGVRKGGRRNIRIAMVLVLVLVTAGGIVLASSAEAGRRVIMQWFTEWGDKDDGFHFAGDEDKKESPPPREIETIYAPSWIPEGFELTVDELVGEICYWQEYMKGKHQVDFQQNIVNAGITIDSDGMEREDVMINGCQGQLNHKKDKTILIWATRNYVFMLSSDLGKEEVLKMAESVKEKKN